MALDLKKKIGPLPIWVWIALAVLALLILVNWKKNSATNTSTNPNANQQATMAGNIPVIVNEGFLSSPSPTIPTMGSSNTGYIGTAYVVQPGDTLQSIMSQYYGTKEANPLTARILTDTNPNISWTEKGQTWVLPPAGSTIYLGPNGITGYQPNSLNRYDPGHALPNPLP